MPDITPFLWFDTQAEEAARFYVGVFKNARMGRAIRWGELGQARKGSVLTQDFELEGLPFTAMNGGPQHKLNPAISFYVACETPEEVDALWQSLSAGGDIHMALDEYPFCPRYGWTADRYGVNWQLALAPGARQNIAPFLMFAGDLHGRAEEAIRFYTSILPDSRIDDLQHHGPGDAGAPGTVRLARFTLCGRAFMAIDSAIPHPFTFNQAVSMALHCRTQAEIDRFWAALTEGGTEIQCSWLLDQFGVAWQVFPDQLLDYLADPDTARADRVMAAMIQMVKIDLAKIEAAAQ